MWIYVGGVKPMPADLKAKAKAPRSDTNTKRTYLDQCFQILSKPEEKNQISSTVITFMQVPDARQKQI